MEGTVSKVTDRLYLQDAYLYDFEATVIDIQENRVELDRTAFYVTGGGQPSDRGTIEWDGKTSFVSDVKTVDGKVCHFMLV